MFAGLLQNFGCLVLVFGAFTATQLQRTEGAERGELSVVTEWEPEATMAKSAAESKLRAALVGWLAATRPTLVASAGPEHITRLLNLPGAHLVEITEQNDRPYGSVFRTRITVEIPNTTLDAWQTILQAEGCHRRLVLLLRIWLSGLIGLAVLQVARKLDARTSGYCRHRIGVGVASLGIVLLAFVWHLPIGNALT